MTEAAATTTAPTPERASAAVGAGSVTVTATRELYPPTEPYDTGLLDVGDGQRVYYEQCGNPDGTPVIFLHGGPGSGGGTKRRRFFDPERYRIICLDQRGCGASTPHVADALTPDDLATNTTWHLVADIEALREHLGIEKWLVFGGSWGSTLALAYAERHTDRVTGLVLRGIFTLRRSELDWFYNDGASHLAPDWWRVYLAPLRAAGLQDADDYITVYHQLLWSEDTEIAQQAALAWTRWEAGTANLEPSPEHVEDMSDPRFALAFARIENHYFVHGGWFTEGQLIADAGKLAGVPTVIVQGQYDLCCPPTTASDLHEALPGSRLEVVMAGHSAFEPLISSALVQATDEFAASAAQGEA